MIPLEILAIGLATIALAASVLVVVYCIRNFKSIYLLLRATGKESEILKKPRKRYVVFAISSEKCPHSRELEGLVENEAIRLMGEWFLQKASPHLVYYDEKMCIGIYRVTHLYKDDFITVLELVGRSSKDKKMVIRALRTTGTLRSARKLIERYIGEK